MRVQYALLSALKNLAIPSRNKHRLLDCGIIKTLYPLIKSDQYLVVFKLLGTFRMIIDGQGMYILVYPCTMYIYAFVLEIFVSIIVICVDVDCIKLVC